jgi:hypothetical protein
VTVKIYGVLATAATAASLLAGCSSDPASAGPAPSTPPLELPADARLAAKAALAQDQYYSATYSYTPARGGAASAVRVDRTAQGFLIELAAPADASSVARVTTIVFHPAGDYYCRSTSSAGGCVRQDKAGEAAEDAEPARMARAFRGWLRTLADHNAPLSVAPAAPPGRATGTCFSVEGVAAALDPPVDAGVYCFDDAGRITALQLARGTLIATGFGAAKATVALPAPVAALPSTDAPPKPSNKPSATPGATSAARSR